MLSRPIVSATNLLEHNFVLHESYIEQYALDNDFQDVFASLSQCNHVEELDYHLHDNLLYHLRKRFIPQQERVNIRREAHTSLIVGHFGVSNMVAHLHKYFYWPRMLESVSRFIKRCPLCAISKPSNRKLGLYTPLPVPT